MEPWNSLRPGLQLHRNSAVHSVTELEFATAQSYPSSSYSAPLSPPAAATAYCQQPYNPHSYAQQGYAPQQQMQHHPPPATQAGYTSNVTYGAGLQQQGSLQAGTWTHQLAGQAAQQGERHSGGHANRPPLSSVSVSGGAGLGVAVQYAHQFVPAYSSVGKGASPQLAAAGARGVGSPDFQAGISTLRGSTAFGGPQDRAVSPYVISGSAPASGPRVYGLESAKLPSRSPSAIHDGRGSDYVAASHSAYSENTADLSTSKSGDYRYTERGQISPNQAAYVQADSQGDAARRYQGAHATAVAMQIQQQQQQQQQEDGQEQSQVFRQQHQNLQQTLICRGKIAPVESSSIAEGDSGLLGAQLRGARINCFTPAAQQHSSASEAVSGNLNPSVQLYAHLSGVGYGGISLPPGRDYSAGRGTGGGGLVSRDGRSERGGTGHDRRYGKHSLWREQDRRSDDERRNTRDRDRDREKGQRDRDKEKERDVDRPSPRFSKDGKDCPLSQREERGPRKDSSRHDSFRQSSPLKERRRDYMFKVDLNSFTESERDNLSVCKRYTRLFVVPEFTKLVACWAGRAMELSLDKPISFEHDAVDVEYDLGFGESPPKSSDCVLATARPAKGSVIWNAKVMLMSGPSEEILDDFLLNKGTEDKPPHLHNLLKFVALRKDRSAIMAAGGVWDKVLDGGDPATDEAALIRTIVRCTKESTELDLSACKKWSRIVEVHYERHGEDGLPSYYEVTVMFLPDISGCVPCWEEWRREWFHRKQSGAEHEGPQTKLNLITAPGDNADTNCPVSIKKVRVEQKEAKERESTKIMDGKRDRLEGKEKISNGCKEEVKGVEECLPYPGFFLRTKRSKTTRMRSMTISLDGLLDYDEGDREECTFELSLFAEVFQEMLQWKMGVEILSALKVLRDTLYGKRSIERKRSWAECQLICDLRVEVEGSLKKRGTCSGAYARDDVIPFSREARQKEYLLMKEGKKEPTAEIHASSASKSIGTCEREARIRTQLTKQLPGDGKIQEDGAAIFPQNDEQNHEEGGQDQKRRKKMVLNKKLMQAFRYFDRNHVGYIKADDLRRLLHCLGKFMSRRTVKELVGCALEESKSRDERILYRNLVERESESTFQTEI